MELEEQYNQTRSERDTEAWKREKAEILVNEQEKEIERLTQERDIRKFTVWELIRDMFSRILGR